jgi:hypothetical protein
MKWLVERRAEKVKKVYEPLIDECDVGLFLTEEECESFSYFTAASTSNGVKNYVKKVLDARLSEGAPSSQQER